MQSALTEAVDYVKTELMPDFDFDAFNHEYPDAAPVAEAEVEEIEIGTDNIASNNTSEEVDKW